MIHPIRSSGKAPCLTQYVIGRLPLRLPYQRCPKREAVDKDGRHDPMLAESRSSQPCLPRVVLQSVSDRLAKEEGKVPNVKYLPLRFKPFAALTFRASIQDAVPQSAAARLPAGSGSVFGLTPWQPHPSGLHVVPSRYTHPPSPVQLQGCFPTPLQVYHFSVQSISCSCSSRPHVTRASILTQRR